jgi:N-acylneuraminate cytidylyltransferase
MMTWSVEAAVASGCFDVIMVSTDDDEIAEQAQRAGAQVPFRRSARTSDDHATTSDVLTEVLAEFSASGQTFHAACCLYATAPFVQAGHLVAGLQRLDESGAGVVMPVVPFDYPIWRSLRKTGDGRVEMIYPQYRQSRSQDLEAAYHDVGQWYWFRPQVLRRDGTLMGDSTIPFELPAWAAQDIDTEDDWRAAEWKHERMFG